MSDENAQEIVCSNYGVGRNDGGLGAARLRSYDQGQSISNRDGSGDCAVAAVIIV